MPEATALGPLPIVTRIAAFAIAVLVARWIGSHLARRLGVDVSWTRSTCDLSIVTGLIAARTAYAALHWTAYAKEPWAALYLWQPGYLPVAGLAGGALCVILRLLTRPADRRLLHLRAVSTGVAGGALLLAASLFTMNWWSNPDVLRAGDRVPEFVLTNLVGERVSLSDLKGKGVVLNFWATWCPPCRREMPLLESVWDEYRSRNIVVVGIALGQSQDVVRPFTDSTGVSYPIWTDAAPSGNGIETDTQEIFSWFGSQGLPTTIFIKPNGVIESIQLGELNRALLLEQLPALINED